MDPQRPSDLPLVLKPKTSVRDEEAQAPAIGKEGASANDDSVREAESQLKGVTPEPEVRLIDVNLHTKNTEIHK